MWTRRRLSYQLVDQEPVWRFKRLAALWHENKKNKKPFVRASTTPLLCVISSQSPKSKDRKLELKLMNTYDPAQRHPAEEFWVENYSWLAEHGYLLRSRYHPLWVPSSTYNKEPTDSEDNTLIPIYQLYYIMDATRMSDGKTVMLKKITESNKTEEVSILHYFLASSQASNPQNHTVPIIELLTLEHYENMQIIVMPFLRPFNSPSFDTIGEGVDFIRQALEAVQFLHMNFVAHRDCTSINFMMDATELYPQGSRLLMPENLESHRAIYTRTEKRPKYYLVNFSSARFYDSNERQPLDYPVYGTDRTVPEFQGERFKQLHDPFATDVYYLGNMIKNEFVHGMKGFEYLVYFVDTLTDPEPIARPTIQSCVEWFAKLTKDLTNRHLGKRCIPRNKQELFNWVNAIPHIFRRVKYVIKGVPVNLSEPLQGGNKEYSDTVPWPETEREGDDGVIRISQSVDGHINRIDNHEEAHRRPSLQLSRRWRKLSSRTKRRPTLDGSIFHPFRKNTSSSQDSESESPTKFLAQPRDSLFQLNSYRETKRHNSLDDVIPTIRRRTGSLPTKPVLIRSVDRQHLLKRTMGNISNPRMPQDSPVEVVLLRPLSAEAASMENDAAYDGISPAVELPESNAPIQPELTPGATYESIPKEIHEPAPRPIQVSISDIVPESTRSEMHPEQEQEFLTNPVDSREKRSTVYQYTRWKYDCHICGRRRNNSMELIEHLVQKHKDYHTCTRCGSCYTTYEGLIKHLAKRGHTMILSNGGTSDSQYSGGSNNKRHLVLTMRFDPRGTEPR